MYLGNFKKTYLKVFLIASTIAFIYISIFGLFGSTEMQAKQHDGNVALSRAESSIPADNIEDLVAWDNAGSIFAQSSLSIFLAIFSFLLLSFLLVGYRPFFKDLYAKSPPGIAYKSPPQLFSPLKKAFSRGLINGKAF